MRALLLGLAVALASAPISAQEAGPVDAQAACTAFDWSLHQERAWFAAPGLPKIETGGMLPSGSPGAVLQLKPIAEAELPVAPTRAAKPDTYAGVIRIDAPTMPGLYQITLSDEGWIDVIQDGENGPRSPLAHTGKRGCPDLRKSLRYQLGSKPFMVEISNANAQTIKIAVAPAE